jgi:hypothetical protein
MLLVSAYADQAGFANSHRGQKWPFAWAYLRSNERTEQESVT